METERVRGNPAGLTNTHVANNIRAARQAIGMDLRTLSDGIAAAGRKLSPSGISKLEAGDRRVDVDDLTVIAYLLRTTPAALLTPPEGQTTLTGVPEEFEPEEIDLIFVPGTAFDVRGHRIGQGGGYYDRYLNRTRAVRVGVCHDFALLDAVPTQTHDARMDGVVTPKHTIVTREETT